MKIGKSNVYLGENDVRILDDRKRLWTVGFTWAHLTLKMGYFGRGDQLATMIRSYRRPCIY